MSSKKHCLRMMDSLPHEVVELILETLPVNSLLRFKAVSKQWNSTIQCRIFQERHLTKRQQSRDPDILMVSVRRGDVIDPKFESLRTLVLGSSSSSVKIPCPWDKENTNYLVSHSSCDGLVCLYYPFDSGFVVNPTTRWHRPLPPSELQQLMTDLQPNFHKLGYGLYKLGFGKDKFTGTYKPVWLYNSREIGLKNATTCEVFDFTANDWRYVTPSPYRVVDCPDPVYVDGSLYWFTDCQETKVLSFDLHTEAFQVVAKAPFANLNPFDIIMGNLDNRLCVSQQKGSNQVVWSFHSDNKTWDKLYSIDLDVTSPLIRKTICALLPLALLDADKKKKKKKKMLLFYSREICQTLLIHDTQTKSYHAAFSTPYNYYAVIYFQSLISI